MKCKFTITWDIGTMWKTSRRGKKLEPTATQTSTKNQNKYMIFI